eukprot:gene14309-19193_t
MEGNIIHLYRLSNQILKPNTRNKISLELTNNHLLAIETEFCFNIEIIESALNRDENSKLLWLLSETFEPNQVATASFLNETISNLVVEVIEVGPRLAFTTAWSSNCNSMCKACGINGVGRIERSRRYKFTTTNPLSNQERSSIITVLHDKMTECVYAAPLSTFKTGILPELVSVIDIIGRGKEALNEVNTEKGLGFDDWDLDFYTNMFQEKLKRNPTDVECFDLGQSNSEHSRHWFFGGKMVIDGEMKARTLFQMVKETLPTSSNSVIAFHDNSSAIYGYDVNSLVVDDPTNPSQLNMQKRLLHPILTAETHNFPSGVAPFPGAETGTGGRLRDVQATGRGAYSLAGISAYCVGNLNIPGNPLPWEPEISSTLYPSNLALPIDIEIEASNGASDYGNKYGEPVVSGFTRSFGQRVPSGERFEWIKPIMFTAGIGMMDDRHRSKGEPEVGMIICKIGGPAYRIGMGGGAASSRVQGTVESSLDFNAVQRGDAEMENRMNRVIRACIEMGENNPIISIHDQGAGGNGNVLKEIVDPLGARLELRKIPVGDSTLSVMEIWGAEYQENNAFLVRQDNLSIVLSLGQRENCPVSPVGIVTGDGRVVVFDSNDNSTPFDLPLSLVLGKMPQKSFHFTSPPKILKPLTFPSDCSVLSTLSRILRLLDVGSKRFLTNKVDRCVTGLVAQQQCVGPLHMPLSNVAVLAQSHFGITGVATSVGEQPIKGLISCGAQARMTVGDEALSNLVFAKISCLSDVKASCNWMWAAKLEGEGAKMYETCQSLCECLQQLGPAIDGGKDSLSMAAKVNGETVKSPGEVTLTCYAPCPDITKTVTPDLKFPGESYLVYIDLGGGKGRLGGTALSTVYAQLGDEAPDMDDVNKFQVCFNCIQSLLDQKLLEAGHDRSDGGLVVTLLEMAFAGNCGIEVFIPTIMTPPVISGPSFLSPCFNEELGFVFEVLPQNMTKVVNKFHENNIDVKHIGKTTVERVVNLIYEENIILSASLSDLRDIYESTSFELEKLQCNVLCVQSEQNTLKTRPGPGAIYKTTYNVSYDPTKEMYSIPKPLSNNSTRMAVIRQEGSNGDREMLSAFYAVGFEVWDVNMHDLVHNKISLDRFQGIIFCGGFSYADVNDSAKGWAGVIKFNPILLDQFNNFRNRSNTFSLGICNGCQLLALLGWVPFPDYKIINPNKTVSSFDPTYQARFIHNTSMRFECRWTTVKILPSPAVLLKDMENSTLGVWVAHGEGKAFFPDPNHLNVVLNENLAPIRYVNDEDDVTEVYPMNPNGSPLGIAALCSQDGRHLAIMPHPERCFFTWQMPYIPNHLKTSLGLAGPWIKLFQNALKFCESTK